jgi:hypothetical protein
MKFKHCNKSVVLIIPLILALASCKKSGNQTLMATSAVDVYVVGTVTGSNGNTVATYWKNGVAIKVADSLSNSNALGIVIEGNDIYLFGYIEKSGYLNAAAYWKNGVLTTLTDGKLESQINSLSVNSGTVLAAGVINTKAALWINGTQQVLQGVSVPYSSAEGIAVSGGNIYVAGYLTGVNVNNSAVVWEDGNPTVLTGGGDTVNSIATAIAINGNDIYEAGSINDRATYWKNGTPVKLSADTSFSNTANDIVVNGSDVYVSMNRSRIGGYTSSYWKNGKETILSNPATDGYATTTIAINGTDVYVATTTRTSGNLFEATYWKNGIAVELGTNSRANGIALMTH